MSYRFREAREKAGLSAAEVGRRIGVSQPAEIFFGDYKSNIVHHKLSLPSVFQGNRTNMI